MTQIEVFETVGSVLGALGALLLATNTRASGWGYVLFLASNVALLAFGNLASHWRFVAMQLVFTGTSLLGLWRWVIAPWLRCRKPSKLDRILALHGRPAGNLVGLPELTPDQLARTPLAGSDDQVDAWPSVTGGRRT